MIMPGDDNCGLHKKGTGVYPLYHGAGVFDFTMKMKDFELQTWIRHLEENDTINHLKALEENIMLCLPAPDDLYYAELENG